MSIERQRKCAICGYEWLNREGRDAIRCPNKKCRSKRWQTGIDGRKTRWKKQNAVPEALIDQLAQTACKELGIELEIDEADYEAACRQEFSEAVQYYEQARPIEWRKMTWEQRLYAMREMREAGSL